MPESPDIATTKPATGSSSGPSSGSAPSEATGATGSAAAHGRADVHLEPVVVKPPEVPAWAIHRRMYDWVLRLAHTRHGTLALFLLSFAESSFFPIPPDVLQIALTLEKRSKAFYYAFVSTVGSVLGGVAGYGIGWGLWELVEGPFYRYIAPKETFDQVAQLFDKYDFWAIFIAAFTPIPYKVFTVSAGVFHLSLVMFIVASIIGRGARFFIVAGLLYKFGAPIKTFIERYFNLLTIVFTLLAVGGFALLKLRH